MSTNPNQPINEQPGNYNEVQIQTAADTLGISLEKTRQRATLVEGSNAVYVSGSDGAVIVDPDGSSLFAHNDVSKNEHVQAYWNGQRGTYQRQAVVADDRDEKSSTGIVVAFILGVLLLIGLIVFFLMANNNDNEPEETITPSPTPTETQTVEPTTAPEETEDPELDPPTGEPEETLPTEEGPAIEEDTATITEDGADYDPSDASVDLPNEFVEDQPTIVSGTGFLPGEQVQFSLTEINLGNATVDSDGNFNAEITIEGPFSTQETTLFVDGAESGVALEETIQLVGSMG